MPEPWDDSWRPRDRRTLAVAAALTLVVGVGCFLVVSQLSRGQALVKGDGVAYFLYAQSIVLDLDAEVTREYEILDARESPDDPNNAMLVMRIHSSRAPATGKIALPWPIGIGIAMAPFYALGHVTELTVAHLQGRPPDIFGLIPQFGYCLGSLFYAFLGFWATLTCCRRLVDGRRGEIFAWIATLAVLFAGPAVFYIFFSPVMAHAATFGFVALLVLLWWRRWEAGSGSLFWLGLLFGFTITLRYQCVMFAPLLIVLVLRDAHHRPLAVVAKETLPGILASVVAPAIHALHYLSIHGWSGFDWRGDGFATEEEVVTWIPYRFFDVLFSCQHGAFYWAPVLLVAVLGLLWAARNAGWARVFLLTFLAHVYLIGSLEHSSAGGLAFGMRYFTECAPFFAAGLTVLLRDTVGATAVGATAFENATGRRRIGIWLAGLGALVVANGLLLLAFGVGTISGTDCVTHTEMARGIAAVFERLLG